MGDTRLEPLVLSEAERRTLENWAKRRKTAQGLALRARIVLACAEGRSNTAAEPPVQVVAAERQAEHAHPEVETLQYEVPGPQQPDPREPGRVQAGYRSGHSRPPQ